MPTSDIQFLRNTAMGLKETDPETADRLNGLAERLERLVATMKALAESQRRAADAVLNLSHDLERGK